MIQNPMEKVVPFNFWFRYGTYQIVDKCENEQHLRVRYNGGSMITPLLTRTSLNFSAIKSCLNSMSLYQPFYPETFYNVWEFFKLRHIKTDLKNVLHIGKEHTFGSMESIMLFLEKTQQTYQYNKYHCWLAGNEVRDPKQWSSYQLRTPMVDYLSQAYKSVFLSHTSQLLPVYDFISIDTNHLLDDIFTWSTEEQDLQANIFYILTAMHHLEKNGAILLRLNMISSKSCRILFSLVEQHFVEYAFFRPSISNAFNSEIYLFLNRFKKNIPEQSLYHRILQNFYEMKIYEKLHINYHKTNDISNQYQAKLDAWVDGLYNVIHQIENLTDTTLDELKNDSIVSNEWHTTNNFPQIGYLLNKTYIVDKNEPFQIILPKKYPLFTSAKSFHIRPTTPYILYEIPFYREIIKKRAELNFCKRIMDTKPSNVFTNCYENQRNNIFITWDHLTYQLDFRGKLKQILKKDYGIEMATSAWIKMYEILNNNVNIVSNNNLQLKTFHLCEAPGAFIAATNHYLNQYPNIQWSWYAQTLKPENEFALDDHYGLIKKYPERWLFGNKDDNSGNITHSAVIKSYATNPNLKDIDFITSDAGLHCHPSELNEQEAHMAKISMGQIICILACLPVGKTAVFKTYLPLTEPLNISMVYLITHLFDQVNMIKPMGSPSYNSEIYFVLTGYKGIKDTTLDTLYNMLDDPGITSKSLLFKEIDKMFCSSYLLNLVSLVDQQIQVLLQNYYYYYSYHKIPVDQQGMYLDKWFELNPITQSNRKLL